MEKKERMKTASGENDRSISYSIPGDTPYNQFVYSGKSKHDEDFKQNNKDNSMSPAVKKMLEHAKKFDKNIVIVDVCVFLVGLFLLFIAYITIETDSHYTWTRPYTQYEARIIAMRFIGAVLMFYSVIMLGLRFLKSYIKRRIRNKDDSFSSIKNENEL